ncbi:MAG TPA: serine/threonine protein kinase [Oscillatoriaceae cyanobacterium M33_DOE_052]|nr:serine/threonine protein kinase [Oscillatoriaceae cyanobacterium M33_DOE_052]
MFTLNSVLKERYRLQRQLGDNPVRQTWLAEDLGLGELVVMKLLPFGGPMQWQDLKLFEREAAVLQQLRHSRIPKYRDYFTVENQTQWFCLVQEYIPGASLKELLVRGQQFEEEFGRQIGAEVLAILNYLHELRPPVLHRDIKPSNLVLGDDGAVYLVDFGAVQAMQNGGLAPGGTFTVVGTYGYTPLEQFGGQAVAASDLYALGATLVHLLTGVPPAELPQADLRLQWRDRVSSRLSPQFVRWLTKLTEPALERRFSTATEALKALTSVPMTPHPNGMLSEVAGVPVRLRKSPTELIIEIPSPLELAFFYPVSNLFKTIGGAIMAPFTKLAGDSPELHPPSQTAIIVGFSLAILILRLVPGLGLGFFSILFRTIIFASATCLYLLPLALMLMLIFVIFGAVRGVDYLQTTRIYFNRSQFEISRISFPASSPIEQERGEIGQIQDVRVEPSERYHNHWQIAINYKIKWAIFSRVKKVGFGEPLNEAQLSLLVDEIKNWLK